MSVVSNALVPTANAAKYIQQLCKHWAHKLDVELTETRGVVRFSDAVATMTAEPAGIAVSIAAEAHDTVERMQGVLERHLDRFAFREAPLTYAWH